MIHSTIPLQIPMVVFLKLGVLAMQKAVWQVQWLQWNFRGFWGSHGRSESVTIVQPIWGGSFHQNLTGFMDLFLKN
jgi:hypothetical protein